MPFPANKTKIVCTIGPASDEPQILAEMIQAGMNIVRLNFSHGDFERHAQTIRKIRQASEAANRRVAIMADLPGPKIRIGTFEDEPIDLNIDDHFTLTTENILGSSDRVAVSFMPLPQVVKTHDKLFLNDGLIELEVQRVEGRDVHCRVLVGGPLLSNKGLNLPGINLGISAFTDRDRECLAFAIQHGVDAVSQSFVENAADIKAVRQAAGQYGAEPFIVAKIERLRALEHIDDILDEADGIMIARGDLGVEIPIEQMAVVQKRLMLKANLVGKPVITATQMLESMTHSRRPSRAEATDVANAILDGTDCVMLSGESAMGAYPVEATAMLAKIAAAIEPHRTVNPVKGQLVARREEDDIRLGDLIALSVETTLNRITPPTVIVPTRGGATARSIARFRLPVWVTAVSRFAQVCQNLVFSFGVLPVFESDHPDDWKQWAREWLQTVGESGDLVVVTEGPSKKHPHRNNRMEILDLRRP